MNGGSIVAVVQGISHYCFFQRNHEQVPDGIFCETDEASAAIVFSEES
jgi:hypothetical protein